MIKLLLVEDDANLSYILQSGLEDIIGGYQVLTAVNGEEGFKAWKEHRPDVIITDVEMPVMNGFDLVGKIREVDSDIPILFASGRILPKDVTHGYTLGANNYVKKPFNHEELDGHICALLKMKSGARSKNETEMYKIGGYTLNAGHAILTAADGTRESLTAREAGLLKMLCENKNEVVKKSAILEIFWQGQDVYYSSRSLDVFVTKLRKKLAGDSVEIKTIKSVGLMLVTNE